MVPVKDHAVAKSRLHPPAGVLRTELAHALALDTLVAALACMPVAHVLVVTSDARTARFATAHGAVVEADPGQELNAALRAGLVRVGATWGAGRTAILLGDLPALDPDELAVALAACARHARAVVPDRAGTGTVLLAALALEDLAPRFGPGSAAVHTRTARRLDLDLPTLRTDVDDDAALRLAAELGLGAHSRAVLSPGGLA